MNRSPQRVSARLASVAIAPVFVVAAGVSLAACGGGSAAPPTDYARPTTTFTTEPVRTTTTSPPVVEAAPPDAETGDGTAAATGPRTYEIRNNDSLARIAGEFGITIEELMAANGWTSTAQVIIPGEEIQIPAAGAAAADEPADATAAATAAPDGPTCPDGSAQEFHEIVGGDTPGRLAERYGTTVDALAAANVDTAGYSSYLLGTRVVIPC